MEHQKGHSELTETNEILDLLKQVVTTTKSVSGGSRSKIDFVIVG